MSFTNGHIPNKYNDSVRHFEEMEIEKLKRTHVEGRLRDVMKQLENIPKAIKDWGYCDLRDEESGESVRLVAAPHDLNLNEDVWVKITAYGLQILEADWNKDFPDKPFNEPKTDAEGYVRLQLWDLAAKFGQHMTNGGPLPIETTIKIKKEGA